MTYAHRTTSRATTQELAGVSAFATFARCASITTFTAFTAFTIGVLPPPAMADADLVPVACLVEVRLTSITSLRTQDQGDTAELDAPGEYFVGALGVAAIGPFDLRTDDSSSFAPGLYLDALDTGWPRPPAGETTVVPVVFGIAVREVDSTPVGEDDHDDASAPLLLREHVVCPGGVTNLMRTIHVEQEDNQGRRRRGDQLRLGLQIRVLN